MFLLIYETDSGIQFEEHETRNEVSDSILQELNCEYTTVLWTRVFEVSQELKVNTTVELVEKRKVAVE